MEHVQAGGNDDDGADRRGNVRQIVVEDVSEQNSPDDHRVVERAVSRVVMPHPRLVGDQRLVVKILVDGDDGAGADAAAADTAAADADARAGAVVAAAPAAAARRCGAGYVRSSFFFTNTAYVNAEPTAADTRPLPAPVTSPVLAGPLAMITCSVSGQDLYDLHQVQDCRVRNSVPEVAAKCVRTGLWAGNGFYKKAFDSIITAL